MLRFSKMADYGILLLGHFARHPDELCSAAELADTYHMPRSVVSNLLKAFGRAGVLSSRRGLHGGYQLALPADEVTLLEILNVIDGPVRLLDCAVQDLDLSCDYEDVCTSRSPMLKVHRQIMSLLEAITLAELMESGPATTTIGTPQPSERLETH